MQPYFFPYFEYFRIINNCDLWISFDTAQFSRGSWMNRNRIINREKGWSYIGLPISRDGLQTSIKDARIDPKRDWKSDIVNKIRIYERFAPNYLVVSKLIERTLDRDLDTLGALNTSTIIEICRFLGIDTRIVILSEMGISPPDYGVPGGWPLHLCMQLGATEYLNASGGRGLYDPELFRQSGVNLLFHEHIGLNYDTKPFDFVPDLSIIDVLMWVGAETARDVVHRGHSD
ncbi:MAG: WbqC family protein [Gammaproteobacteria bacterium]|nr:WbqC family protein [Gammaproteobacteria bacterium]